MIIAGKSIANKEHDLREYWLNTLTELDVGIDAVGVLKKGKPIVLACHGKGILISDYFIIERMVKNKEKNYYNCIIEKVGNLHVLSKFE